MADAIGASPRDSFGRLSTSTKMLIILTAALLPLGLIALFASVQSARAKQVQREADAQVVATAEARQIDILLLRGASLIRTTLARLPASASGCARMLRQDVDAFQLPVQLALFDADGHLMCATHDFAATGFAPPPDGVSIDLRLREAPAAARFTVRAVNGGYGVGEVPTAALTSILPPSDGTQGIQLIQERARLVLSTPARRFPLDRHLTVAAPIAGGQATLRLTTISSRVNAIEVLLVLLPLLMWAAAAAIGWLVVDQALVRPLRQLEAAVVAFKPGDALALPRITGPSQEIRALAEAFARTSGALSRREHDLEEGLQQQVKLTREVHHRVKNNLQVVASLINLHARGSAGDVAAAYASIQRRVDALAVVHRHHYAELEENRGVALRAIVSELTANLRATAAPAAAHLTITLDMVPAFVTQDVAVPVAFLVTEIVELVMTCDPSGDIAIALGAGPAPDRAILSVRARGLAASRCADHADHDRFERIVTGLSRQLRAPLDYDADTGTYRIALAVLPQSD